MILSASIDSTINSSPAEVLVKRVKKWSKFLIWRRRASSARGKWTRIRAPGALSRHRWIGWWIFKFENVWIIFKFKKMTNFNHPAISSGSVNTSSPWLFKIPRPMTNVRRRAAQRPSASRVGKFTFTICERPDASPIVAPLFPIVSMACKLTR